MGLLRGLGCVDLFVFSRINPAPKDVPGPVEPPCSNGYMDCMSAWPVWLWVCTCGSCAQ